VVFYLLFGIAILHRQLGIAVMAAWLAILIAGQWLTPEYPFDFFLYVKNLEFFVGMAVAHVLLHHRPDPPWWVAVSGIGVFVGNAVLELMMYSFYRSPLTLVYAAGAALVIFCLSAKELRGRNVRLLKPLSILGDASYSIYLVHVAVISATIKLSHHLGLITGTWTSFLMLVAAGGCGGILFHLIVERRLLQQRGRSSFSVGNPSAGLLRT